MFASRYLVVGFRESVVCDSTLICFDSEGGCGNGAAAVCNDVAAVGNGAVMADAGDDMAAASRFTPLAVFLLFDDVTTDREFENAQRGVNTSSSRRIRH